MTSDAVLTGAARRWAGDVLGARVVAGTTLTGGVSSRMLLLRTDDGREAVLRQLVEQPYRRHADGLLPRERAVHGLLAATDVPAPTTLALDVTGEAAGDPSLLMTRLDGAIELVDGDAGLLAALADALLLIHAVRPPGEAWPRRYQSWATEAKMAAPPPWSRDDDRHREAFARLRAPAPSYVPAFLHRDFQPANVLWRDGDVAGVVDWVETSTGPVDLDVAHCASNLAGLHGVDAALAFRQAYVDRGGVLDPDPDAAAYWQLLDLVGFLPDGSGRESGAGPGVVEAVWSANGRPDLTVGLVRRRREDLLHAVLG